MAKRKITNERAFDRAAMELDSLVGAMAEHAVASTYDALLEAAARLKDRLSANYTPSPLPTDDAMHPSFARLEIDTDGRPFPFSDHPDAVAARLLGAYRYGRDLERRPSPTTEA